jgi:lipoate-protein ligase A
LTDGWTVARRRGAAGELHARPLGPVVARRLDVLEVERAALVLGSTQPSTDVDQRAAAAAGIDVVRRRRGGGAVLLVPSESAWIDVELPRGDAHWVDDVSRSFDWLGRAWRDALSALGIDARPHAGPLVEGRWSRLVCFGGIGPGELVVDGRKLVGISQRRTRHGARFQCVVHRRWDPAAIVALLALDAHERRAAVDDLERAGAAAAVDTAALVDALVSNLPPS